MYILLCILLLFVILNNHFNFSNDNMRCFVKKKGIRQKIGKGSVISKSLLPGIRVL